MKTISTLFRSVAGLFVILIAFAAKTNAQTASISPSNSTIVAGESQDFTVTTSGFGADNNNRTFVYTITGPGATIPSSPASFTCGSGCNNETETFTFNTPGTYTVSVTVTQTQNGSAVATTSTTITVTTPPPATVSVTPASASTIPTGSVSFSATVNNFTGTGAINYTWSVSPGTAGVDYVIPTGNTSTKSITFNTLGEYTVSVTASRAAQTASTSSIATVFQPNLYSTSGTGTIRAYRVIPVTGAIQHGPVSIATPVANTVGLGKNRANANDANGNLYYILNPLENNGIVEIYTVNPNGGASTSVGSFDMNGAGNTTRLGFVRLAFDQNGLGWIIAGDGASNIYIASFRGNGVNPISNINTYGNTSLNFGGAGSAAEFQNGDIAFGPGNVLYALANVTGGNTYIYTLNSTVTPTTLTRKWTVQTGGGVFAGTAVNGVAWTQTGSLHISTGNGIYFIDQTTANSSNSTVQAIQVSTLTGLTDLASSEFPSQTTLPVSFGEVAVKKAGANAEVSWSTLSEFNNSHFIVERSTDAVSFKAVGTVSGKGNSSFTQYYSFIDAASTSGVVYYRIKQVDVDGASSYSKTVALRSGNTRINNYSVYPNPFVSNIKVLIDAKDKEDVMIRINNLTGQTLITKRVTVQAGNNIVVFDNLQQLQNGLYMLEVVTKDGKHTQKLIKN